MAGIIEEGIGIDADAPNPYSRPLPVEQFRWDRTDGYLKWKKALASEMADGTYVIQYSDTDPPTAGTWTALATVTHNGITGQTGSYQDLTGSPGRIYRIKKVTSAAKGSVSSIYVGVDVEYEQLTDRCWVMVYARELDLDAVSDTVLKAEMEVAAGVSTVDYHNVSVVPVLELAVKIEPHSGLLIIPLIPSAYLLVAAVAVKYKFTLISRGSVKKEWTGVTVPTAESAFLMDII